MVAFIDAHRDAYGVESMDRFNHRRLLEPIGNVRRRNWRCTIFVNVASRPSLPDSNAEISGKAGTVHLLQRERYRFFVLGSSWGF